MELFRHEPLNHDEPSIRLLRVSQAPGPLRCTMRHATIPTTYTCLSYRWGKDKASHRIFVNNKAMLVRDNLFDFLEAWRQQDRAAETGLWVDAMCIDGSDIL
ncbi:hypothetical protein BU23DRAFT_169852 [Bimuria novae-zelandiae CBS 107.79]|uniref:Heterokaryon incompatibility domain-containing protein n=1 Tax=Bimuria novae-zelandiae CBS 107.79 TaxID=1447943 RepID=A0A6A5V5U7_9PLEO|nr:hypothetical protein BU23DRAFT_169852 [Bimuria novae-zelandiae CBS 107.79]